MTYKPSEASVSRSAHAFLVIIPHVPSGFSQVLGTGLCGTLAFSLMRCFSPGYSEPKKWVFSYVNP